MAYLEASLGLGTQIIWISVPFPSRYYMYVFSRSKVLQNKLPQKGKAVCSWWRLLCTEEVKSYVRWNALRHTRRGLRSSERLQNTSSCSYLAHSTRGASSTTAALSGMSTQQIMARVGWSSEDTFSRHYYKGHSMWSHPQLESDRFRIPRNLVYN